ncbi:MAG TPA: glycine dehydrogenase (aminomethyl-transferring), partial [Psychromonas hadalis]|nr:glycine dehydrogenase (aminomethyl-transferring) [Psychromonas hadalis]
MTTSLLSKYNNEKEFATRHNGPTLPQQDKMLSAINADDIEELIAQTVPKDIRPEKPMPLEPALSEAHLLAQLKTISKQNKLNKSYIGQGYYNTETPNVVLRNVFENPGWYTAYTPYQPEISQGRLESLLNYQQMIMDLTAMEVANASLLDEATAAAEAMSLCKRAGKNKSNTFFVADDCHPQTIDVVRTRAEFFGFELIVKPMSELDSLDVFGALVQYPNTTGNIVDLSALIYQAHAKKTLIVVASDLLSLTLLKAPGEMDADVVIGNTQRFGVPIGFGGPHAAFMATRDKFKRTMPGRIIGVS